MVAFFNGRLIAGRNGGRFAPIKDRPLDAHLCCQVCDWEGTLGAAQSAPAPPSGKVLHLKDWRW
jgi:hypothetical protein